MFHRLPDQLPGPAALDRLWIKLRSVDGQRGRLEQQLIDSYMLIAATGGQGCLTIDLDEYRLRPDTIYVAWPGQTIGVSGGTEGLELYRISFEVRHDSEAAEPFPLKGEITLYPESQTAIQCELLLGYSRSEDPLERFRGQAAFHELLYGVMKHKRQLPVDDSLSALERTRQFIESRYNENLTIEQLARIAELSPKYFVDLFKKTYGKSAIDYVTEVRVNHAKQLMVQSETKLRDIAHQVGYSDEFYFSRKFKQAAGVSPSAYMKKRRRKIAAYTSAILGHLLALGIVPYAAPMHPKWTASYHKKYRSDIPVHLSAYRFNHDWEANVEALAHARPDLILCHADYLRPDELLKLEAIAPVHSLTQPAADWRQQLRTIAGWLDATAEAERWLGEYERKLAAARELLKREIQDDTVLVLSIHKNTCLLCPRRGMREVLYGDLRLNAPGGFDEAVCGRTVSFSELADIDAGRILVNVCQETESLAFWQSLQANPLWKDLRAVRRNYVHPISSDPWREYSASAAERMVDDMIRHVYGDHPVHFRKLSMFGRTDVDYNSK
ncbi:ABC transporter substrate-binding protein [Paenibacillus sp. GCM10012303]|jgi:ABC-type Fe3+-hydroxamate transport system substrate-binding protein|uniref:ABC transporter substrate-binding protein n=1 Tax=Paenibacillus sp. GCM10012303 TaxID=3317340 RepID=UPI00361D3890